VSNPRDIKIYLEKMSGRSGNRTRTEVSLHGILRLGFRCGNPVGLTGQLCGSRDFPNNLRHEPALDKWGLQGHKMASTRAILCPICARHWHDNSEVVEQLTRGFAPIPAHSCTLCDGSPSLMDFC